MSKESTAVTEAKKNLPALANLYEEDAGAGFENADATAYAIPFLSILQSGSPQVKKSDGAYIKGAEEGMFFNSVTNDIFDGAGGLEVIPCYYKRVYLKWAPRDSGGGFGGEFLPSDPIVATVVKTDKGDICPDGDFLADTRVHYVLLVKPDGTFQPAVISMASTQVKKSRTWMSKMEGIKFKRADGTLFTPPMYSHVYKLTTVPEKNDQGSWFGWQTELVRMQEDPQLFAASKEFKRAIAAGEIKEKTPVEQASASAGDGDVSF